MADQPTIDQYASKGGQILSIICVFTVIATIAVALRLYTRFALIKASAADDICLVLALLFSVAVAVATGIAVKYGAGRHIVTVPLAHLISFAKALFAIILFYNFSLTLVKLSILSQYLRVSTTRLPRRFCYAMMAFIIAYGVETFATHLLTCRPMAYFWDKSIPGGRCLSVSALYFANAGLNIATDFALLIFPFFLLRNLQMRKLEKFGVAALLACGGLACIASILRLHALYIRFHTKDITWAITGSVYWSNIELNMGIACTSVSALRPLATRYFPRVFCRQHERIEPLPSFVLRRSRTAEVCGQMALVTSPKTLEKSHGIGVRTISGAASDSGPAISEITGTPPVEEP